MNKDFFKWYKKQLEQHFFREMALIYLMKDLDEKQQKSVKQTMISHPHAQNLLTLDGATLDKLKKAVKRFNHAD